MMTKQSTEAKRFLFLFSDTGGGHRASAQAVAQEMTRLYGDAASIEMLDIFVEMGRWPFDKFPRWYPTVVGLNGVPWGIGYRLSNHLKLVKAVSRLTWPYTRRPIRQLLHEHPADVIVSFHGLPNYILHLALQTSDLPVPLIIVALDLVTVHASWFTPGAATYLVPTEAAKDRALRWGLPTGRVEVTGMPIRRCFVQAQSLTRAEARARLGLPHDETIVMVMGGGEGMGPFSEVTRAITAAAPSAYVVAITGRNRALYEELSALQARTAPKLHVEGFVSDIEVWMRAADLLVTKAGPNSLAEAFVMGLPLVLYTALPGQETGNVTHVVEHGAGVWAPTPSQAAHAVRELLAHPDRRREMAARSRSLALPRAAESIAQQLWHVGQIYVPPPLSLIPPMDLHLRLPFR